MDNPLAPSGSSLEVIQLAVTPVIMLSGVGALMITLTNRMGRVVDRTRGLAGKLREATRAGGAGAETSERDHIESQLAILWRRAGLIRRAVTYAGLSMLLSCLLVMGIFLDASSQYEFGTALVVTFLASVICLIAALVAFLRDIWMSLHALQLEVDKARER